MSKHLNIAALCESTRTLGPGQRFAIWVQGCCFQCLNCGSPEWREIKEAKLITPQDLAARILSVSEIEGLTISGGEPMLQAGNLLKLIRLIRSKKPLTLICYTGFGLEELKAMKRSEIDALLSEIDVLIDGRYMASLNDNKGWRGSTNQKIHFLTGRYKEYENVFLNRKRDMEMHLFQDHYLLVGIKPKGAKKIANI